MKSLAFESLIRQLRANPRLQWGAAIAVLGIIPAFFSPVALVVTGFIILGGVFNFFAKPKAA